MTSFIGKYVAKKVLGETLSNKFGTEDPYFETIPATRLEGKQAGKVKKRKKALPPGISEHDGRVLTKVKRRAYRLDMALFSFLGVRFGWGSAIGIIPVVGDVLDALLALMVLKTCCQIEGGLPTALKIQMFFNIALDFIVGLIPFLGDLVDAVFRANTRNAVVLEKHLREKGKKELRRSGMPIPDVDPSSGREYDRDPPAYDSEPSSTHGAAAAGSSHNGHHEPQHPPEARVKDKGGWFGGRNKARPEDVEMGTTAPEPSHAAESKPGKKSRRK